MSALTPEPTPLTPEVLGPPATNSIQVPTQKPVGPLFYVLYVVASFGLWLGIIAPASVGISVRIGEIAGEGAPALYSMIVGIGGTIVLPLAPIMGALSDRSRSRFGRRRPFILVGAFITLIGLIVVGTMTDPVLLILGYALMNGGNAVAVTPLWAVIADRVPQERRGLIAGIGGATLSAANLTGAFLITRLDDAFLMLFIPGIVGFLCVLLFAVIIREAPVVDTENPATGPLAAIKSLAFNPIRERNVSLAISAIIALSGALSLTAFNVFFLQTHLGFSVEDSLVHFFTYTVIVTTTAMVFGPIAGRITDRLGTPRFVYAVGIILVAAGLLLEILMPNLVGFFVGTFLIGIAQGIQAGQSITLVLAVGSSSTAGRNLGLVGLTQQLPGSVFPLFAPLLLNFGGAPGTNFPAYWIFGAIFASLGLAALVAIRRRQAPDAGAPPVEAAAYGVGTSG